MRLVCPMRWWRLLNRRYMLIDGATPSGERFDNVKRFQTDESCRVAILSLLAASQGITLTAADTVVFAGVYTILDFLRFYVIKYTSFVRSYIALKAWGFSFFLSLSRIIAFNTASPLRRTSLDSGPDRAGRESCAPHRAEAERQRALPRRRRHAG